MDRHEDVSDSGQPSGAVRTQVEKRSDQRTLQELQGNLWEHILRHILIEIAWSTSRTRTSSSRTSATCRLRQGKRA